MNVPNPAPPMLKGWPKFVRAIRRATATFVFTGLGGSAVNPFTTEVAAWKPIVIAGAGGLVSLVYRWAEKVEQEPGT